MSSERRRVRCFVAAHLAAVSTLYALAQAIGGGWADHLPPDLRVAAASAVPAVPAVPAVAAAAAAQGAELPDWAQRPELNAPWESR